MSYFLVKVLIPFSFLVYIMEVEYDLDHFIEEVRKEVDEKGFFIF